MYKGVPAGGIEFYQLLFESDEFCAELGKVVLVAGKLETELVIFFERKGLGENTRKATLGRLIQIANKKQVLDKNLVSALETVCTQRNYLTHNIFPFPGYN